MGTAHQSRSKKRRLAEKIPAWIAKFQYGCAITHMQVIDPFATMAGDNLYVWEAGGAGVVYNVPDYTDSIPYLFSVPIQPQRYGAVIDFLNAQVGKAYDILGLLAFLRRKKSEDPDKWFCSELAAAAAVVGETPRINTLYMQPWMISPHWLLGICDGPLSWNQVLGGQEEEE